MSKEIQNKPEGWKSKLDSLDDFSGETEFGKNELWERLHTRLGGKKRSRKLAWYWIAAACILFALTIPSLYFKTDNQQISTSRIQKNNASRDNYRTADSSQKIIEKKDFNQIVYDSTTFNNELKTTVASLKKNRKNISEKQLNIFRLPDTVSEQNILPEVKSNLISPMDSPLVASIPSIRKKLKVVHINELGGSVETLPEIVRNSDKHVFQFKIASQETYINPATASNTNGFTILKIKTSQN